MSSQKNNHTKADRRTVVYLPEDAHRELHRIAEREGRSVSSLLRQLALERVRAD